MKFLSPLIADARNKLGDSVFARNASGLYARAYKKPANPRSTAQQLQRAAYAQNVGIWRGLDQSQRDAWIAYARTIYWKDTLGQTIQPSGWQLFQRCNLNNNAVSAPLFGDPPNQAPSLSNVVYNNLQSLLGPFVGFKLLLTFDPLSGPTNNSMLYYVSKPLGAGVNFCPMQSYRFVNATGYEESPTWDIAPYLPPELSVPEAGQKIFVKWRYVDTNTGVAGPEQHLAAITE